MKRRPFKRRRLSAEDQAELAKRMTPSAAAVGFLRGVLNTATPESLQASPEATRGIKGLIGLLFGMVLPEAGIEVDGPLGEKIRLTRADGQAVAMEAVADMGAVYGELWMKERLREMTCPCSDPKAGPAGSTCPTCHLLRRS